MRRIVNIGFGKLAIILFLVAVIVSVVLTANMEVSTGSAVIILEVRENVSGSQE